MRSHFCETLEARLHLAKVRVLSTVAENPRGLTIVGNEAYFFARSATLPAPSITEQVQNVNSPQLWKTDGTPEGTVQVTSNLIDFYPFDYDTVALGKYIYFFNDNYLYRSDGTSVGTKRLSPRFTSSTYGMVTNGTSVIFTQADGKVGANHELWAYDSAAGLRRFDVNPGSGSSDPQNLVVLGSKVFFRAHAANTGYEIFESDGTAAGTHIAIDVVPGTGSSSPTELAAAGGKLYFSATDRSGSGNHVLWVSDGTAGGSRIVSDAAGKSPADAFSLTTFGHRLILGSGDDHTLDPQHPPGLWVTDGTSAGTISLGLSNWGDIYASDNVVFFRYGSWLGCTDGTPTGTRLIEALGAPVIRGTYKDRAYVDALDEHTRDVVWISDGTRAGTFPLTGSAVHPAETFIREPFLALNDNLLIPSEDRDPVPSDFPAGVTGRLRRLDLRLASISGCCFRDLNANGAFDPELDQGYYGYTVFLDLNQNEKLDQDEPRSVSDTQGKYHFDNLKQGTYQVRILATDRAAAVDAFTVTLPRGRFRTRDFALAGGTITGFVFDDANANEVFDTGEDALSGFRIYLDLNGDGHFQSSEPWVRTNSAGKYRFDDLPAKSYRVSISPISTRTLATAQAFHINLARGASATRNFGTTIAVTSPTA